MSCLFKVAIVCDTTCTNHSLVNELMKAPSGLQVQIKLGGGWSHWVCLLLVVNEPPILGAHLAALSEPSRAVSGLVNDPSPMSQQQKATPGGCTLGPGPAAALSHVPRLSHHQNPGR